jgi:hypothetical protein
MENLDFLNLNSLRAYPIKEGTTRISIDGNFNIPDNFLVDLIMSVDADVNSKYFISDISNTIELIIVTISNQDNLVIGTFTITTATHTLYQTYSLVPTVLFAGANGKVVVGYLDSIKLQPTGAFKFDLASGELETRTILPLPIGLTRLIFKDDTGKDFSVTGDVSLLARLNLRFRLEDDIVKLDAGNGLGLNKQCAETAPCINTINGIPPDQDGNFTIGFVDCDSIQPATNGILLSDSCNKPCMGCDEISTLNERLITLESDLLKIRDYFNDLNTAVLQLGNVVDNSCELP